MNASREVYRGRLISVSEIDVTLPNGVTAPFDVVQHPGAAAVVAFDDKDNVVLIRVFRPAVEEFLLELPAGKLETGEDPLQRAKAELREEVGAEASDFTLIARIMPAPGYSTEAVSIYAARNLVLGDANRDNDEVMTVALVPFDETLQMISDGKIVDGKTIVGLLLAADARRRAGRESPTSYDRYSQASAEPIHP